MKMNGLLLIGIAAMALYNKDEGSQPGTTPFPRLGVHTVDITPLGDLGISAAIVTPSNVVVTPAGSYIDNHYVGEDPAKQQAIAAAADAMQRAERTLDAARALYQSQESTLVPYNNPASGMQPATTGYYYAGATEAQVQALAAAERAYEDARLYLESLVRS